MRGLATMHGCELEALHLAALVAKYLREPTSVFVGAPEAGRAQAIADIDEYLLFFYPPSRFKHTSASPLSQSCARRRLSQVTRGVVFGDRP